MAGEYAYTEATVEEQGKNFDAFADGLLSLADAADEAGLHEEADRIAVVLPAIKSLKTAQYEGVHNYWIANGRAFELAWKNKRKTSEDPSKYRSANDCWWEVLEEYQKSLLGDQKDFIAKYAGRQAVLPDKASAQLLVSKISKKISQGSSPGVSLYESIEEMASGDHAKMVSYSIKEVLKGIAASAKAKGNEKVAEKADSMLKEAGFWDFMSGLAHPVDWAARAIGGTEIQQLASQIQKQIPMLDQLEQRIESQAAGGGQVNVVDIKQSLQPFLTALFQYNGLAQQAGVAIPKLPSLEVVLSSKDRTMNKWTKYFTELRSFATAATAAHAKSLAAEIQKQQYGKQVYRDQPMQQIPPEQAAAELGQKAQQPQVQQPQSQAAGVGAAAPEPQYTAQAVGVAVRNVLNSYLGQRLGPSAPTIISAMEKAILDKLNPGALAAGFAAVAPPAKAASAKWAIVKQSVKESKEQG